jgi:hypothetical protein
MQGRRRKSQSRAAVVKYPGSDLQYKSLVFQRPRVPLHRHLSRVDIREATEVERDSQPLPGLALYRGHRTWLASLQEQVTSPEAFAVRSSSPSFSLGGFDRFRRMRSGYTCRALLCRKPRTFRWYGSDSSIPSCWL